MQTLYDKRKNVLDNIIANYKFKPFSTNVKKHLYKCLNLDINWKVIQHNGSTIISAKIKKSLCFRYPVYYGKPIRSQYYIDNVPKDYTQPFGIKYAVCGISYIFPSKASFISIHTWSPNLESTTTTDYFALMQNGHLNVNKYETHLRRTLYCIVHAKRIYNLDSVYCPFIGQGAFLNSLKYVDKVKAHKCFFKLAKEFKQITFVTNSHMFDTYFSNEDTNILHDTLFKKRNGKYGIVNAWDSNSYIGNGLSKDATIDGFYVAGWGANKILKNSSFLHNPFFHIDC